MSKFEVKLCEMTVNPQNGLKSLQATQASRGNISYEGIAGACISDAITFIFKPWFITLRNPSNGLNIVIHFNKKLKGTSNSLPCQIITDVYEVDPSINMYTDDECRNKEHIRVD